VERALCTLIVKGEKRENFERGEKEERGSCCANAHKKGKGGKGGEKIKPKGGNNVIDQFNLTKERGGGGGEWMSEGKMKIDRSNQLSII